MEEKKNTGTILRRSIIIAAIILAALIAVLFTFTPGRLAEQNYEKGMEALNSGQYEEAIGYLEKSEAADIDELIKAIKHHLEAQEAYEAGDYDNAYDAAGLVPESYPRYDEVRKIYEDSLKRLIDENLRDAKKYFDNEKYIDAYDSLKIVLKYDPENQEALQLKEIYRTKSYEMQDQLDKGGYFLIDNNSIRQREMVNIDEWNAAGYTGKGLTIFHDDTGDTMHSINCAAILQTILPDARILRGTISGTTGKDGAVDAYINCYTTGDTDIPFDEFILKNKVSLINNSTAGGNNDSESSWAIFMRDKIKQYNLACFGSAGNEDKKTNRFYGAFIMVSGVSLKSDNTITDFGAKGDVDFSMFMGYQSGTSYASPFLCGMAGLLRSKNPNITQDQVYQYFKDHSMQLGGEGKTPEYGWGLPILGSPEE